MSTKSTFTFQPNVSRQIDVQLVDGSRVVCQNRGDAELVLDADRRHYEGDSGRILPRETLAALERTGRHAGNSMLYRSAMRNVAQE
jgi:hypothetical protein